MNETPQLSELANEITRLEVSLKTKKCEYTRLKNSVAPIAILPNELLASIFEAGCNTSDTWTTPSSPHHAPRSRRMNAWRPAQGPPFEILVSQVTRHWRNVAHQTPNLWTRVTLDTRTQHYLGVGADYIARSGALPLDLRIDVTFVRDLSRPPIKSICHLICPEAVRWGQLRMRSDWYAGLQFIFDKMPGHAPMLRYIDLCYDNPTVSPPDDPPLPKRVLTGGCPLTRIVLKGVTLRCHFPPLGALKSLECHYMTLNSAHHMIHDLFSQLTHLTRLVLNDIDFDWAGAGDGFELPALTALYLRNIPDYDEVLAVISAPALHTLYLNTVDSNEMLRFPDALALADSGAPKFPHLRALFIKPVMYEEFSVTPESWRALALITPAVTHFGLLHEAVDEFLQALARTHVEPAGVDAFMQSGASSHSESTSTTVTPTPLPIAWPGLHTISFPEASRTCLLDDILSARMAAHCPIRRVQASRDIMAWLGPAVVVWHGVVDIVECDLRSSECRELEELYPVQWHGEGESGEGDESWFDDGDVDDISDFTDLSSAE